MAYVVGSNLAKRLWTKFQSRAQYESLKRVLFHTLTEIGSNMKTFMFKIRITSVTMNKVPYEGVLTTITSEYIDYYYTTVFVFTWNDHGKDVIEVNPRRSWL